MAEELVVTELTTPRGQSVSNALQLHAGTGVLTGLSIVCPAMEPDHTISVEVSTDGVNFYPLMFQGALVMLPITGRAYHLPAIPSVDFLRLRCSQVETEDRVFQVGSVYASAAGGDVTVANFPAVQPVNDNGGSLTVDGSVGVSNFPSTQPVSATALPLPSGASTEATLALIKAKTDNLDVALSTRTKPADVQAVSAAALPLPTGASTEATLALIKAKTDNLDVALSTRTKPADTQPISAASLPLPSGASTEATLALIKAKTDNLDVALSTRTKPADTQAVSAAALPLPAGASTEATLALIKAKTDNLDVALSTRTKPADTQAVSAAALPLPAGASTEATLALIKAKTDNLDVALSTRTKPADTQAISAASLPLPSGAATEATLAAVKAKTDLLLAAAKGTQTATGLGTQDFKDAGRTYVVFTYDRITGITTEALATMTINKGGSTSSATTYTVTAGKTLRLQSLECEILNTTTVINRTLVRVRSVASVNASSPIVGMCSASAPAALAAASGMGAVDFPDGIEIAGGQQIGMSHLESVTTAGIASACLVGFEY